MTPQAANTAGATLVSKDELFEKSDILTVHLVLSSRTRGLVGIAELERMKPSARLINASRGAIVEERKAGLLERLQITPDRARRHGAQRRELVNGDAAGARVLDLAQDRPLPDDFRVPGHRRILPSGPAPLGVGAKCH